MSENKNLKARLIIAIVLFVLAIIMLVLGLWAFFKGKEGSYGFLTVSTKDVDARITAQVTGSRTTDGEGYDTEKVLWDSDFEQEDNALASWKNIDFTFAGKDSILELTITVENRNTEYDVNALFTAKLGDTMLNETEQEIGDTNILASIVAPVTIGKAIDDTSPTIGTYKVILKIANTNKDVKDTELDVNLTLTNPSAE